MSAPGPKDQQNVGAEVRRILSKPPRRKSSQVPSSKIKLETSKPPEEGSADTGAKTRTRKSSQPKKSTNSSSNMGSISLQGGEEKDFDRTQWELTRCSDIYKELRKKSAELAEEIPGASASDSIKKPKIIEAPAVVPAEAPKPVAVTTEEPKPVSVTAEVPKESRKYEPFEALAIVIVYCLQLGLIIYFLSIIVYSIYVGLETLTDLTIIAGSIVLLSGLIVFYSTCFEIGQYVSWKNNWEKKRRTARIYRHRTIAHLIKSLLICAGFFLVFEIGLWSNQCMYILLSIFIFLIAELYMEFYMETKKDEPSYEQC